MAELTIYTIPDEYYGGAVPKAKAVKAKEARPGLEGAPVKSAPLKKLSPKTAIVAGIVGLFLAVLGAATWYFTKPLRAPQVGAPPAPEPAPEIPVAPAPEPAPEEPKVVVPPEPEIPPAPPSAPPGSEDTDRDGLSNTEEALYRSGLNVPDTDQDGYLDGHEVVNLYNPSGIAPERLEAAGLARLYRNEADRYGLLVPTAWRMVVADNLDAVFLETAEGERIASISVIENPEGRSVEDWYAENAASLYGAAQAYPSNKYGVKILRSEDGKVAYGAAAEGKVIKFEYLKVGAGQKAYGTTFEIMLNSFKIM